MTEDNSPLIGIFWMISVTGGTRLLAASCPLDDAEHYGDCLTFGPGHYEIWQGWQSWLELDAAERAVVRAHEYEDWPRGRIVFDRARDRLILYCDRKLMRPGTIERIRQRFRLPLERTAVEADFHYQSKETPKLPD
jgi:hypothetical protein